MGFDDAIGAGASAAAIGGALYASGTYAKTRYDATLGSRHLIAKKLNRLAVGTTRNYVESLFGVAVFEREVSSGVHYYVYRTPHAWVGIQHGPQGVQSFSITVTDSKFRFSTESLTFGGVAISLGRSPFSAITDQADGRYITVGANRFTFAESFYFGNPGNYQHFVFSHSQAGCGDFTFAPLQAVNTAISIIEGDLSDDAPNNPLQNHAGLDDTRAEMTVNTIVTGASFLPAHQLGAGVDHSIVRALPA
jgi:hypothetical protein